MTGEVSGVSGVAATLERVRAALPGGEHRPGQLAMAEAVADALDTGRHLLVQAGTGTGKTLAYLVPTLLSGRRVVVATATKALQEQLVHRDLPFLQRHLGRPFRAALLKGRANYLCRAALADVVDASRQGSLVPAVGLGREAVAGLVGWSDTSSSGDRAEAPEAVGGPAWASVSVGGEGCPGRLRCAHGEACFAELARDAAAEADLVVVNTHLYGMHLASGGAVLPEHDVVVVDEAHAFPDVAADTLGLRVGAARVEHVAAACRRVFTADHPAATGLSAAAARLSARFEELAGRRVDPGDDGLAPLLVGGAEAAAAALAACRELDVGGDAASRRDRLASLAASLAGELRGLAEPDGSGRVAWVEAGPAPALRRAPVDVGAELAELFARATVVLTSATLAVGGSFEPTAARLGLAPGTWRGLDVGSPFDHHGAALLYCAAHLPDPRSEAWEAAALEELEALVRAAGGRTLALFTSHRAMGRAADHLRGRVPYEVLVQDEQPRAELQRRFREEETSVLLATLAFWQGFDAPGPTCSLVVIDRLPFARPDDPMAEARREAATRSRANAFVAVDLPAAAVLLAQGAGRLLRTTADRGVVAVLDRRLATGSYRWTLVNSLPPLRRTREPEEARAFLRALAGADT